MDSPVRVLALVPRAPARPRRHASRREGVSDTSGAPSPRGGKKHRTERRVAGAGLDCEGQGGRAGCNQPGPGEGKPCPGTERGAASSNWRLACVLGNAGRGRRGLKCACICIACRATVRRFFLSLSVFTCFTEKEKIHGQQFAMQN